MRTIHHRLMLAVALAVAAGTTHAASITVNTATDDFGSVGANCSLREAIESANNNADFGGCVSTGIYNVAIADVITLPTLGAGGFFTLTRIDDSTPDDNAAGDLDVDGNVRIDGVSAANSVIRGNTTDPDSDRHRLMHIISGNVVLNDLTLRHGLENGSTSGGGLRSEPGSATILNRVTVAFNIAGGSAGGILNRSTMTLNGSLVSANEALGSTEGGGGGIYNSPNATLTLNDSRVLGNKGFEFAANGGGIYSDTGATLTLDNSVVDGNLADGRGVIDTVASAGGIHAEGTFTLIQSSVTNNEAVGSFASGGGIETTTLTAGLIDRSVVSSNLARESPLHIGGRARGGGISWSAPGGTLVIQDSVISLNRADSNNDASGGGLEGVFRIVRSTIASNQVTGSATGQGGGLNTEIGGSAIVNSTFIGNQVDGDGGGIYSASNSLTKVRSSTFVENTSSGVGGGIRVQAGNLDIANTVLAGNSANGGGADCSGTLLSGGGNLVQTGSGCALVALGNDQLGASPGLAPAANNGGPIAGSSHGVISSMSTRSPLPNSLLLDAGNVGGCLGEANALLATDQIGRARAIDGPDADTTARCDIGAVEYSDALFVDGFE